MVSKWKSDVNSLVNKACKGIIDEIKAPQILFNEEIDTYIAEHVNINDSAPSISSAYSSEKTEALVDDLKEGNEREISATLLASGWTTNSSGYYVQTINLSGIVKLQHFIKRLETTVTHIRRS